jgi:hypothetical protein
MKERTGNMKKMLKVRTWRAVFDDPGAGAAAGAGAGAGASGTPDKKFSQDEVNRFVAEERRKNSENARALATELEALKTQKNLSSEDRASYEARISELQTQFMTKEEIAKQKEKKLSEDAKKASDTLTAERDGWKTRFEKSSITRAITSAALKHEAFNESQIVAIVGPGAHLAEMLDSEGKPTGEFEVKVKFTDAGADGKPVTLDLTVEDAVKRLSEKDEFANLFRGKGTGGTGGRGGRSNQETDPVALAKSNPAKYMELRKSGKLQLK